MGDYSFGELFPSVLKAVGTTQSASLLHKMILHLRQTDDGKKLLQHCWSWCQRRSECVSSHTPFQLLDEWCETHSYKDPDGVPQSLQAQMFVAAIRVACPETRDLINSTFESFIADVAEIEAAKRRA